MNLWSIRERLHAESVRTPIPQEVKKYSLTDLCDLTQKMLDAYTGSSIYDVGLNRQLRENQEEHRRAVSFGIRNCCSGNFGAKETVKEIIREYLAERLRLSKEAAAELLGIGSPVQMPVWHMLEVLMEVMDKEKPDYGFLMLCERFKWGSINEFATSENKITREQITDAYLSMCKDVSEEIWLNVLVQIVFAKTVGLGIIDTLNQQKGCIEEIQIGMTGKTERDYDYRKDLSGKAKKDNYCKDGIHVLMRGTTVWIPQLSFETEEELKRVLRNLIKESHAGELTQNHPMIVVDTVDGRRISVSRPPMTDSWVGLIRKFDTIDRVSLEQLYRGTSGEMLLVPLIRHLVRSGRNIAITGEMASGKTTLFRACIAETRKDRNIRVIEADSFELNVRAFLPTANTMTMRVSEGTPAEEVLAFARKTTGQIFAIGEINSAAVAAMAMDLSKIASQLLFSAHYVTTEHMIADFVNAKLCVGGYSEEKLAQMDVVRCLGFDIHLRTVQGKRFVQYINEIMPLTVTKKKGGTVYQIRPIYHYDEEQGKGIILNRPGELTYASAQQELSKNEYEEFCRFFEGCMEKAV